MISKHILEITFLNEPELIFFGTQLNGFTYFYLIQLILFTINYLLNIFKYCYASLIIQSNISHLLTNS